VAGSVTVDGKPAENVHLKLDGADWGNTDAGGQFLLTEVGTGQHRLHLELVGAKPRDEVFSVASGQTALQVGSIEMEPLVRLGYAASAHLSSAGQFDYDITLWIIGDPGVLSRIKSVSYTLPIPLSSHPVRGASVNHAFCYRQAGSLSVQDSPGSNGAPVLALAMVDLGGGKQFQISAPAGTTQPPDCSARRAGSASAPSTTPTSSQQPPPPPTLTSSPPTTPPPPTINVPSVIGKSQFDAANTLQDVGLTVNAQQQQAPASAGPVPPGVVWSQSIQPDTHEPRGTTITIFYQPQATTTPTTTSPTATPSK
jgi:hypothetical protein